MTERTRQLRQFFLVALLLFVSATLALTSYMLWRSRAEAILNGIEISSMHSRSFEDFITQSLHVTELIDANIGGPEERLSDPDGAAKTFTRTLRHVPFLRSMSLLNDRGLIIASSNPANLGMGVVLDNYLPPATKALEILRIGTPWTGRDFADGQPGAEDVNAARFIPMVRTLIENGRTATLLTTLNPDYFINHMTQIIDQEEGTVEVVRYDGMLLMSTDPDEQPGSLREYATREMRLAEAEIGEFEQKLGDDRNVLTAFRASRLYPFVVVTHIKRDYALRHWQSEAKTLLGIVIPTLLAIVLLAVLFYRRQFQLAEQQAENERLQRINATVFDASTEATLITDLNTNIVSINPAFTRVTGYSPEDVIGLPLTELMTDDDIITFSKSLPGDTETSQGLDSATIEVRQRCKDGSLIWTEILSTAARNEQGKITGYYRISRNITARKLMEDQVRQLAFHDHLTNLPNRRLLKDHLTLAMANNKRTGHYSALIFLDLDNFKQLNDCHGHDIGDSLLIETAARLKSCVRETDTVARFGGDEFVVLVNGLGVGQAESVALASLIAEKIRVALAQPYALTITHEGEAPVTVEHHCTSSIGIALFINHEAQDCIIKWADDAMYEAKAAGGNQLRFHAAQD
jgi:diguanylate cyclase (GGDEF)-like protein/PAS domain S-box-containing protein